MDSHKIICKESLTKVLGVSHPTVVRLINQQATVLPDMAIRLERGKVRRKYCGILSTLHHCKSFLLQDEELERQFKFELAEYQTHDRISLSLKQLKTDVILHTTNKNL